MTTSCNQAWQTYHSLVHAIVVDLLQKIVAIASVLVVNVFSLLLLLLLVSFDHAVQLDLLLFQLSVSFLVSRN